MVYVIFSQFTKIKIFFIIMSHNQLSFPFLYKNDVKISRHYRHIDIVRKRNRHKILELKHFSPPFQEGA